MIIQIEKERMEIRSFRVLPRALFTEDILERPYIIFAAFNQLI